MKQVWIVKATVIDRYDEAESNVRLEMAYDNREDAYEVYAHGERACADRPDVRWSLEHLRIEDKDHGVEYGKYSVDQLMEEME